MEKNREELIQGLERLGITAGEEEVSKLISFSELLLKWNKVYNLTAIRDELWTLGVAGDYLLFPCQSS